jgi:hypothetical protein
MIGTTITDLLFLSKHHHSFSRWCINTRFPRSHAPAWECRVAAPAAWMFRQVTAAYSILVFGESD